MCYAISNERRHSNSKFGSCLAVIVCCKLVLKNKQITPFFPKFVFRQSRLMTSFNPFICLQGSFPTYKAKCIFIYFAIKSVIISRTMLKYFWWQYNSAFAKNSLLLIYVCEFLLIQENLLIALLKGCIFINRK